MIFSTVALLLPTLTSAAWMFGGSTGAASTMMSTSTAGSSLPAAPWQPTGAAGVSRATDNSGIQFFNGGSTGVGNGFGGVNMAVGQPQHGIMNQQQPAMASGGGVNMAVAGPSMMNGMTGVNVAGGQPQITTIPQQPITAVRAAPAMPIVSGGTIFGASVQGTAGVTTTRIEGASSKDFHIAASQTRIFGNDNNNDSGCSGKGKGKGGSSGSCSGKGKGGKGGKGGERGRSSSIRYEALESGVREVNASFSLLSAVGLASALVFFSL